MDAQLRLHNEIRNISRKHGYASLPGTGSFDSYCFYVGAQRVGFKTLEFAESFSRVTGLEFDKVGYTLSTTGSLVGAGYDHIGIMETLETLTKKVASLENDSKTKEPVVRPTIMSLNWWKEFALYAPK